MDEVHSPYVILGGGVAGLTLAALLARQGRDVTVIEKSEYPSHKVCGEYVSNEVLPFLEKEGLAPTFETPHITRFQLSDTMGNAVELPLDLGGFGISRYALDLHLYNCAKEAGARILTREKVEEISFDGSSFTIRSNRGLLRTPWLIGAFGKRSTLDRLLNRPFFSKRSPYMGVKYHVKNKNIAEDTVALHNFPGGYCGVNAVENGSVNICYLAHRSVMKDQKSIQEMEEAILFQNPEIRTLYSQSEFLWEKPLVINEISFETKAAVEDHILMCGDAAGMITPLCGNGMAIAMHSARMLANILLSFPDDALDHREDIETLYRTEWRNRFAQRLRTGRYVQKLFGKGKMSNFAVHLGNRAPTVAHWIMSQTHGVPFS